MPNNDLPLLPPKVEIESKAVLKACIAARAALAELRMAGQLIPNPSVLINSIPILEAQASSEIENIVTTTDRLFRFADDAGKGADPATKEALRYRTALREGFDMLAGRPVCTTMAVEICRTIKGAQIDIRATPGAALINDATGATIYTPPEGADHLRGLLANWERWIHEAEDVDPLIRMAVMHYQFEAIHPFMDGNGRTGRVLNLLYLVEQGLLDIPVLYLSRHIIAHKADYYRLLLQVTMDGIWDEWIHDSLVMLSSEAQPISLGAEIMSATPLPVASLWLLAAETDERDFIAEIERLAARHGTPVFHPHLTLLGDIPLAPSVLEAQTRAIAAAAPAFAEPVEDIVTSDLFFRSFYAGFPLGLELQALRRTAIREFNLDPGLFTPHVSLLYGPVAADAKAASAAEVLQRWKGREVRFDRLAITNSGNGVPIAAWRSLTIVPLG